MASRASWLTLFLACTFYAVAIKAASDCSSSSGAPIALTIANVSIASQDTSTYGIRFDVGDPKQNVCLTPSTVVDNTLLVSKNICAPGNLQNMTQAQCRSYHGGTFDLTAAGASFHNLSTTTSLPEDPGWETFNPNYTVAGDTNLDLVSNLAIPNMTVVVITEGINFTAGHLGLGRDSVILRHLKGSNKIPSLGFGLNAGSQSSQNPRNGNLVLGGYDSASVTSPFYTYPMNYSDTLAGRHCPLQVQIQRLQLLLDGKDPYELIGIGDGHAACIEPYDNLFRLSNTGLTLFKQLTGWSETLYDSDALYVPEPGLLYPSTTGFNGSLKFFLDDGLTVVIPNSELQQPLRGLDKNGGYATQSNVTQVKIYENPLDAWVLGKVFLSRAYLAVNYDAQQIQLAEVTQNDVTPSPVRFDSAAPCEDPTLSKGAIAAIVLGSLVGLALICGLGYWFFRRSRRRNLPDAQNIPRPVTNEIEPVTNSPWQKYEMPGERRTSELPADGVYPLPTPRDPYPLRAPRDSYPPPAVPGMPVLPRGRAVSQASTRSDSPSSFLSTQTTHITPTRDNLSQER